MSALRRALAGARVARARLSIAFWSLVARARLRAHGALVGRGLRVRGPIRLHCHRTGSIRIGDHCRIQSGFAGNAVGGGERFALWVGPDAQLQIGNRVGLSNATVVCMDTVAIGDEVLIGGGARIYDTDFHSLDPALRALPGNPGARTGPVRILARAFVGGHAILLKGTRIGEGAVIGAGAVVRGRVPGGEIWTGNPARFARRLTASETRPVEAPATALRIWR